MFHRDRATMVTLAKLYPGKLHANYVQSPRKVPKSRVKGYVHGRLSDRHSDLKIGIILSH